MRTYTLLKDDISNTSYIQFTEGDVVGWIYPDPANPDYQRYLTYVANGNKEPASTLPSESSIPTTPQAGE